MSNKDNKNIIALRRCLEVITSKIGTENLAISLMVTANLMWPLGFLYVTEHHFSPFQTSLARGLSICLTHILICRVFGIDLDFRSWHDIKYLFIRNSLIIFHQIVYAGLHFILPFPLVNSIIITGPLFVFVIDYYINNITITKGQAVGILIGFAGVLININGEYVMSVIDPSFHF
jgi:drug/metabolite transporter (DMT)-like permease